MTNLAKAAASTRLQKADPGNDLATLVARSWPRMAAVLPAYTSPDRMMQLAISSINQMPELAECSAASVLSCLMRSSSLGLEPSAVNGLGECYILPFFNKKTRRKEATFIPGYKGLIKLARNTGEVKSISAHVVHEGDDFDYSLGLHEDLTHKVTKGSTKGAENVTHAYCVCHFMNGGYHIEVMDRDELEAIRARSKAKDYGPWKTDTEEMYKKTVIRRASKMWPLSTDKADKIREAAAADETDGGFEAVFEEPLVEMPSIEVQADEPEPAEETLRKAACKSCGGVIELTPDVADGDMGQIQCPQCGASDWEM